MRPLTVTHVTHGMALETFVQFVLVVYLPWWVTCGTAIADDAGNDLLLLKVIASYHYIDSEVAKSAFQATRHYYHTI